jgi:hypothetical protein
MSENNYDRQDKVRLIRSMRAGALKLAAYTVMDPETGEHGCVQYHMTYDNHVMALMNESAAKLFAGFVTELQSIGPKS